MASCLKSISDQYDRLSYSEKLFSDYVLIHPSDIIQMSIHELAYTLGISPATIIGAVKKLGFSGYKDFKIQLASETNNPIRQQKEMLPAGENQQKNTYASVAKSNIVALEESISMVRFENFEKAVEHLIKASHICFFGIGSSALLANEAFDLIFRLGLDCSYIQERDHQFFRASVMKSTNVAVIVSQTGVNKDNLRLAELLKKQGVPIIGISNYTGTPFAKLVDVLLAPLNQVSLMHDNHYTFRIPIFCVIETLYYMILERLGEDSHSAMTKIRELTENTAI